MKLKMLDNYRGKLTDEALLRQNTEVEATGELAQLLIERGIAVEIESPAPPPKAPSASFNSLPDNATRAVIKSWLDEHGIEYDARGRRDELWALYESAV